MQFTNCEWHSRSSDHGMRCSHCGKKAAEVVAVARPRPAVARDHEGRHAVAGGGPCVIRMLPRVADVLRRRIGRGNLGLREPRSIIQGRNTLFGMFGGKVPLRRAPVKAGEKPYLIARVGLSREVLLEAASAGSCVKFGSGGRLPAQPVWGTRVLVAA